MFLKRGYSQGGLARSVVRGNAKNEDENHALPPYTNLLIATCKDSQQRGPPAHVVKHLNKASELHVSIPRLSSNNHPRTFHSAHTEDGTGKQTRSPEHTSHGRTQNARSAYSNTHRIRSHMRSRRTNESQSPEKGSGTTWEPRVDSGAAQRRTALPTHGMAPPPSACLHAGPSINFRIQRR